MPRTAALVATYLSEVHTGEDRRCPAPNCRAPWKSIDAVSTRRDHVEGCDYLAWCDEHDALLLAVQEEEV